MVYTIVAGENAPQMCENMKSVLARLCTVVRADIGLLTAPAQQPELLLWHGIGDVRVSVPHPILVFGETCRHAACIEVPDDCVVIASTEDEAAACYAARRGLRLLDCGLSNKASLTFSSIGRETGVISLQRTVADLYGVSIEPLELPIGFEPKPYFPMLASIGVLLLSGLGSRLAENRNAKIWI